MWWQLEAEARTHARTTFPRVADLCDRGFALVVESRETMTSGKWQKWEAMMALALQQAENTAAGAWELAFAGYYTQSGALMRLITEYLAIVWYLPGHPDEAEKWNDLAVAPPSAGSLLQAVFANDTATSDSFGSLRKDILNRYAHQDSWGLRSILGDISADLTLVIDAGARFNADEFEFTARLLLPLHASIPLAINQWRGHLDPDWRARAIAYRDDLIAWVVSYEERAAGAQAGTGKANVPSHWSGSS